MWRDKAFRRLWIGQTASILGDRVTGLALPWLILARTHSAFDAGLVSAARYLPLVALGLAAGLVADRVDRRRLMIACDLMRAAALGAVVIVGLTGRFPPLWLLALVVFALGAGQLGFGVAYRAWLPDLTGDESLGRATAALEASDAVSTLAGPPIGGVIIGAIGPVFALGADAISYIISALTLALVRPRHPDTPITGSSTTRRASVRSRHVDEPSEIERDRPWPWRAPWGETLAGVRAIVASPVQRLLRGVGTALYLDAGAIELLLATLAQRRLHLPAWQAGLVFGAAGIGGLLGSALAPRVYASDWWRGLAGALCVMALASLGLVGACLLDPARGFVVALIANCALDGAAALGFVGLGTATTLVTPRELRGRVNAADAMYASAVRAVAVVGAGSLAVSGNPLPAFLTLACCCAGAALIALRAHGDAAQPGLV